MNSGALLEKRRDKLVIMAEILEVAKAGALKTQIMYKAGLSFLQLTQYLHLLTSANLMNKTNNFKKEIYKTTPKGFEFIRTQQEIVGLLSQDFDRHGNLKVPFENSMPDRKGG
jgi:predicted transcriptional regulator